MIHLILYNVFFLQIYSFIFHRKKLNTSRNYINEIIGLPLINYHIKIKISYFQCMCVIYIYVCM